MRKILYYLILIQISCFFSCENESIAQDLDQGNDEDINADLPENTATDLCEFTLTDITVNETKVIDCIIDLNGEIITLPDNVTLEFDRGDIINGTIIFGLNSKIAGQLLNSSLNIEGDVKLINPTFKFHSSRWDIVQGETTSDIAFDNKNNLEKLFFFIKSIGGNVFQINELDAFFEITRITPPRTVFRTWDEAINIPSDFTVEMTDNTHLRTFTAQSGIENGAIFVFNEAENATIKGGNIYGDRDKRIYSSQDVGLEGTHLIHIVASKNVTVDNVNFIDGSKGAITIYSKGFTFNDNYIPTQNATIKNCTFKNIRRMGIALTDGQEVLIEGNTFIDSGQASTNSDGGEVGYAINVEPYRTRDPITNELIEYQKVQNAYIKNNTEINSRVGFVTITIGQNIIVEDNIIDTRVVSSFTNNSKIINNKFNSIDNNLDDWAIFVAGTGETVFDNEIAGNEISGYSVGIIVGSNDAYIHDNNIYNVNSGLQLTKPRNARIQNNTINAINRGINATNTFIENSEISTNEITTENGGFHFYFVNVNQDNETTNYQVLVTDNKFYNNSNKVTISISNGITFKDNVIKGGLEMGNSNDIIISNNKIEPHESDGIRLFGTNSNIIIENNMIREPTGADIHECIDNNSDNTSSITLNNNSCI